MITADEYKKAFEEIGGQLHHNHRQVLRALMHSPAKEASGKQLAILLQLAAPITVYQSIGLTGKAIYKLLGKHPDGFQPGEFQPWTIIATGQRQSNGDFRYRLRDEVTEALTKLNFAPERPIYPEEYSSLTESVVREGSLRQVWVNAFERNPEARERCLAHHGSRCQHM